jgi:lipopolysaccharide transport system permease protein
MGKYNMVDAVRGYFCLDYKFLVENLISRNLKIRYRKSILGMFWTLLIPAGLAAIYYIVFYYVLKVNVENYLLVIICGIVPWTFFANAIGGGTEVLVTNYGLLNKVPLPPHSVVFSDVCTHFLNLILGLPVIFIMKIVMSVGFSFKLIQLFPLLVALFLMAYALALILSIIYVYFRDLKYLVGLVIQFWFYMTPVMYSAEMIPEKFRFLLYLNPIGSLFVGLKKSVVTNDWMNGGDILACSLWTIGLTLVAYTLLTRVRYKVVEIL